MSGSGEDQALARFILELRSKGLTDLRLLTAFEQVPRARFLRGFAPETLYAPVTVPLACGEEATDPFTLARHLVLLDMRPGLRVLEIGTGSGFLTAILARIGGEVTSVERYRTLLDQAGAALAATGHSDVTLLHDDGLARREGRGGGFDRIIVNGAVEAMPGHLIDRLAGSGVALAHRIREGAPRLTVWKKDLSGQAVATEAGRSRMGAMREGVPAAL